MKGKALLSGKWGGGRIMLHNVLVANKMVNDAERRKKPCLVFKVDFEKVYDYTC